MACDELYTKHNVITIDAECQTDESMPDSEYKSLYLNLTSDLNNIYQDNCVAFRFEAQGNSLRE